MAGIDRFALLSAADHPGTSFHVAAHVVSSTEDSGGFRYTELHSHDFAELNILLSEASTLAYRYEVDGEVFEVASPATVLLRAGSVHRMEAISGTGTFLCIHLSAQPAR